MTSNAAGASEKRHWVRLTRVCNQRCLFCLDRDVQDGTFVDRRAVRRDLARGRREGLRRVVLSGGEPTIHPDFVGIVALARTLGYRHIQAITNGRRLCYPAILDRAVEAGLGEVTFSLHGHTPELHDALTRVPGSFVQALTGLRAALARPGLIVSVDVVVNRLNLARLRELLEFYLALGVREFDLLALTPFADAWRNREDLFCDFSLPEQSAALRRALELSRRDGVHLWTNRLRPEFLEGFEELIQPADKILDEVRGRRAMFSRYRRFGEALPCAGPACPFCFLRGFCRDLEAVRSGPLPPRAGPLCLSAGAAREPAFRLEDGRDVFDFGRFYIRSRYFVKGSRCAGCAVEASCDGVPVEDARRGVVARLRPVRGGPDG